MKTMKTIKALILVCLLIQGATALGNASREKNETIKREIALTNFIKLIGSK